MGRTELILSSSCLLSDLCLLCSGLVDLLPLFPRALRRVQILLIVVGTRKLCRAQHGTHRNDGKFFVRDGVLGPLCPLLGILECAYVLGDPRRVQMVLAHLVLQLQDIKRVEPATNRLEVVQYLYHSDLCVEGITVSKFPNPRVLHGGQDELLDVALRSLVQLEV